MSPLWFLPSIALGVFYAFGSGNWMMLGASLLTALITLILGRRNAAIPEGPLKIVGNRVWLGEKRLPRFQVLWSQKLTQAVVAKFNEGVAPSPDGLRALRASGWRLGLANAYLVGVEHSFQLGRCLTKITADHRFVANHEEWQRQRLGPVGVLCGVPGSIGAV